MVLLRDDAGKPYGGWAIVRDITERKQAEETLRQSREQLRERAEELETIMGSAPVALWVAHDPQCNYISGNLLAGQVWHGELVNKRKDDTLYHEEMTVTPVRNISGEITHFIAIKQDVSERKRAEEALHQARDDLGRANAELERTRRFATSPSWVSAPSPCPEIVPGRYRLASPGI